MSSSTCTTRAARRRRTMPPCSSAFARPSERATGVSPRGWKISSRRSGRPGARTMSAGSWCAARWPIPAGWTPRSTPISARRESLPRRSADRQRRPGGTRALLHAAQLALAVGHRPCRGDGITAARDVGVPTLVVCNGADEICTPGYASELFEAVGHDDRTFIQIDGATTTTWARSRYRRSGSPPRAASSGSASAVWPSVRGRAPTGVSG